MIWEQKFIVNDFYYKNIIQIIFTMKMHWKWFFIIKFNINSLFAQLNGLTVLIDPMMEP